MDKYSDNETEETIIELTDVETGSVDQDPYNYYQPSASPNYGIVDKGQMRHRVLSSPDSSHDQLDSPSRGRSFSQSVADHYENVTKKTVFSSIKEVRDLYFDMIFLSIGRNGSYMLPKKHPYCLVLLDNSAFDTGEASSLEPNYQIRIPLDKSNVDVLIVDKLLMDAVVDFVLVDLKANNHVSNYGGTLMDGNQESNLENRQN